MSKKHKQEEPNEITEMWKEHRKHVQSTKAKFRTDRTNTIFGQIFELKEAGVEVFELTPYQYRLVQGNHKIDYYPTSGKYFDLNKKEWRFCPAHKILTLFTQ